jgi:hypothetical protein
MQWIVSFRIGGESLDPASITSALGIQPSRAHRKGDFRSPPEHSGIPGSNSTWDSGQWLLESPLQATSSLEEHLAD